MPRNFIVELRKTKKITHWIRGLQIEFEPKTFQIPGRSKVAVHSTAALYRAIIAA
jgi:hypothetical protein